MQGTGEAVRYRAACGSTFWQKVFAAELDYLLPHLRPDDRILSVGCGPAILEGALAEHGFNVVGLDVSQEALCCAPDRVRTVVGSAEEIPFADANYDLVLFIVSLQFIGDYRAALKEAARVLKPDGRLIALLLNPASSFFKARYGNEISYVRKLKHTDLLAIEQAATGWFDTQGEYFLGILDEELSISTDPATAALYVLHGAKRRQPAEQAVLDRQNPQWERTYNGIPAMFGDEPSEPARYAAGLFRSEGVGTLLELGAGQGRDTLLFAQGGCTVQALDYSPAAVTAIRAEATAHDLAGRIVARRHDVREPLPFADCSLDACYSHMLFCMALTRAELAFLAAEVRRVLRPGGLCIYTVRHTGDPHFGTGIHRGENLYEVGGFIVHFFSRELVTELARGFTLVDLTAFEEGALPRKLWRVTLRAD